MKNAERFELDAAGQWWYRIATTGVRGRAKTGVCVVCEESFLSRTPQETCSYECRAKALSGPRQNRRCQYCTKEITSKHAKKYCSHKCAAAARHKRSPIVSLPFSEFKNETNPHFSRDEAGQWWHYVHHKDGTQSRTRAKANVCKECASPYLTSVYHNKNSGYCGRGCSAKANGVRYKDQFKGPKGGNWKGGRRTDKNGYVLVWAPDHPSERKVSGRYMFEHRLVMEKKLGRYLEPHESVHHINGVRDDNRPENLELWSRAQPAGQRTEDKLDWAKNFLLQHGYDVMRKAA